MLYIFASNAQNEQGILSSIPSLEVGMEAIAVRITSFRQSVCSLFKILVTQEQNILAISGDWAPVVLQPWHKITSQRWLLCQSHIPDKVMWFSPCSEPKAMNIKQILELALWSWSSVKLNFSSLLYLSVSCSCGYLTDIINVDHNAKNICHKKEILFYS